MIAFLRKYVFHNFLLKIVALAAAILLWTAVARDPLAEIALTVPIEFQHVPQNLEISSESIPETQIRVRGPGRSLRGLGPAQVHATVDLSNARPGEQTFDLTGPHIQVPHGVEVVQVVPSQLHLTFDRQGKKQVPIKARVIGMYAGGPRTEVEVVPPTAVIVGPEKRVQAVETAFTDAMDATGLIGKETFTGVHVFVTDPLVRVVGPASVSVVVTEEQAGKPAARR